MNIAEESNCLRLRRTFNSSHPNSEIIASYDVPLLAQDTISPARS